MTTDMDTRLREHAARWRAAQEDETSAAVIRAQVALAALVEPPRRSPRSRAGLAVAASVVTVAVIGAVTTVLTHSENRSPVAPPVPAAPPSSSARSAPASVPWSAAGVRSDRAAVTALPQVGAPDGLRRCANGDVTLVSGTTRALAADEGWLRTSLVLRSVAATPCAVPNGFVEATLVDSAGTALPVDAIPIGPPVSPSRLEVRPGQLVSGTARWAVYEGRASRPTRLVINLSGQTGTTSTLSVPLASVTIPPHPYNPSNQGPWRSTAYGSIEGVADPGTLASLTAALTVPATVRNGDVLRYTVTLTNPTATAVTLTRCPDFVERLDVIPSKVPTAVGFRGPLNCTWAPEAIGAGQAVGFAFELATAGQVPGPAQLTWQLLGGGDAAVSTTTELTVLP